MKKRKLNILQSGEEDKLLEVDRPMNWVLSVLLNESKMEETTCKNWGNTSPQNLSKVIKESVIRKLKHVREGEKEGGKNELKAHQS